MGKKEAIKSLSLLWLGSILGSGSTFILYMILARYLGVEQFGLFSSALGTITIFSLLSGFGVAQSWLKHFGKEGWNALRWLPSSFKLIFISIVMILLFLVLWGLFGPHDEITKKILLIMSIYVAGQMIIELVSVKFQLEEKYSKLALWQLLPNLLRLILVSCFIFLFSETLNVLEIAYIYAFLSILFILFGLYQLKKMPFNLELKGHGKKIVNFTNRTTVKEVLSHSWTFGLASFFAFIYLQSDIIMVKYISGDKQAGLYNIGFIIMTAILIFPTVFYQKFLMPKVHRWAISDTNRFYKSYRKGNVVMLIFSIVVMLFTYFLSSYFVPLLFGMQYTDSIIIVKILSLSLPFYFIAYNIGATLVTSEHMKEKVKLMGLIAVLNIILNLILIPKYNALGAAVATVVSNILLTLLYYIYAETKVFTIKKRETNVEIN